MDVPTHLAAAAFDGLLKRGDIIHYSCDFGNGDVRNKFAVVLNATLPDDPILVALSTSRTQKYNENTLFEGDIIRVAAGTYPGIFDKDTILNFRQIRPEDLDVLRKQFAEKQLVIVGKLLKVHLDHADRIVAKSLVVEGWKKKRCTVQPAPDKPADAAPVRSTE